jgi:hypothetical protein
LVAAKKIRQAWKPVPKELFVLILLCLPVLKLTAQEPDTMNIQLFSSRYSFQQLVKEVESHTVYHFFYQPRDLDTFSVVIGPGKKNIKTLLDEVFNGTPFTFILDADHNIFITRQDAFSKSLPADFFDLTKTYTVNNNPPPSQADTIRRLQLQTSVENKLFEIGTTGAPLKSKVTLAGYVRDARSGEPIAGASVSIDSLYSGVVTDQFGYYSLTVAPGQHLLHINSFGMKNTSRRVLLHSDGKLDIDMSEYVASLKEVIVSAARLSNVSSLKMGTNTLTNTTIKQIPVVFGEADLLRAALTLPGVTSVGEANTGLNVRGGAADQNLILLNDATIYNPSHLFGFFSAFNADIVKSVELYKTAIPEKYGGRLSSVLDVVTRQGNTKKIGGAAGIGPLTSKIVVDGPVGGDRTSFIAGVRSSYSNWLLQQVPNSAYNNSKAFFYDADLHVSHNMDSKNSLFLNGYFSHDGFRLLGDTSYRYGNQNFNLKWKHNFNNQFYGMFTAGIDRYRYSVSDRSNSTNAFQLSSSIKQNFLRTDFNYAPTLKHIFTFGLTSIYYQLQPGLLSPLGQSSLIRADALEHEQGLESSVYIADEYSVSSKLSVHAGLRYSVFNYFGPHAVYQYTAGVPRSEISLTDTVFYPKGKMIKTYGKPELRLTLRYQLSDNSSVKLSFNTMTQFIHTLSNTNSISPTDVLKLSDSYIRPQEGRQISAGFYRNFNSNAIETSFEIYYKQMKHYLDYRSGAELILNHHIETDVIDTRGKAWGAEVLVKKTSGKLTGWFSYTYSRVQLQSDDPLSTEKVNGGNYYPANFDKPHNANFTGNYKFSHRYILSLNLSYSTGRPITLPLAIFDLAGAQRVYYSERNQFRTPDYFRADFSFVLQGNHKITKLTHNDWTFGVYNITGRKNVYSIYFVEENGYVKGYKLSIFGVPIPFVTYTIRF